jgi:predicted transcriptional regulator
MTATPRFVRVLEIHEENFGTEIHVRAFLETDEGGRVPVEFRYNAHPDVAAVNRANAYDALFAKAFGRASHADVEAAKLASKTAGEMKREQPIPVVRDVFEERGGIVPRRVVTDPDHVRRMHEARIDPDPELREVAVDVDPIEQVAFKTTIKE